MKPTKNNVLLEIKEKKLLSGIVLEGQSTLTNEFFIVEVGPDVDEMYKKGSQAILGVDELRVREMDKKKYAITEDHNIIAIV